MHKMFNNAYNIISFRIYWQHASNC